MLEIITKTGISLDLPSDIQIDITIENPFMSADKIPTPYSLSINLPNTPLNMYVFGNPHLVTSINVVKSIDVELRFNGIVFFGGYLVVDDVQNDVINVIIEGVLLNGISEEPINKIEMKTYRFYHDYYSEKGKNEISTFLKSAAAGNESIVIAPIRNSAVKWDALQTMQSYDREEYFNAGKNQFNVANQSFEFPNNDEKIDFPYLMPMIKINYLFDAVLGEIIDKNPFTDYPLNKLVLIPTYLRKMPLNYIGMERDSYGYMHTLYINKTLSNTPIGDVIKDLLKLLCASIRTVGKRFNLELNRDIISRSDIIDWTEKIDKTYSIKRETGQSYKWGLKTSERGSNSDETPIVLANYKTMSDYPYDAEKTSYFEISDTGEIFRRSCTDEEITFDLVDQGISDSSDNDGDFDACCDLKAIKCSLFRYATTSYTHKWKNWYIPMAEFSSNEDADMYIGIHHGYAPTLEKDKNYPLVSSHNYDMLGNKLCELTLITGYKSYLAQYHNSFSNWLAKEKTIVTTRVNLNVLELKELDIFNKVHILGKNFYIRTLTIHLKNLKIEPSDVELIEA